MLDSAALRLLACGAFVVLVVCLLVLPQGPSESAETSFWVLAFAVALPAGLVVAARQARSLSAAAPAAAIRALAAGLAMLALALLFRRAGTGDQLHHGLLAIAALGALAAPFLAARRWRDPSDEVDEIASAIAFVAVVSIVLLFVPRGALRPGALVPALLLTAALLLAIRLRGRLQVPRPLRLGLDGVICAVVALAVIQLPDLVPHTGDVALHHGFFLGPANDVLHGRAMLAGAWSQYGVGAIDALALAFTVLPIGFGTLALVVAAAMVAQYLCAYLILRLAGLGQVLTLVSIAVAGAGSLFATIEVYVAYPSNSPLRFGLPYLIVLCAVIAARYPRRARPARLAALLVLGIAAIWSFETFAYCGATYGALVLVEAMRSGDDVLRRVLRAAAAGLAASALAVALFSLFTLVLSGQLDWGPYFEYLRLYSVDEFSQLPIVFFSAGPLMAAAIFASAVGVLWLVREYPRALEPQMAAAIAGFTGIAAMTFTYYLGRSHPNNLLVLLLPVVALGGLWIQVLSVPPVARWRTACSAALALGMAMIAVAAWPSVEHKWKSTALALSVPGGESLGQAYSRLHDNPVLDSRAPAGARILAERLPAGAPALVLTDPNLTTEILFSAGRRNLLPISHPPEDVLIESSQGRVRAASERVPAGTLLLTSPLPGTPGAEDLERLRMIALAVLQRRFAFQLLERTPEGLELVRLVKRR